MMRRQRFFLILAVILAVFAFELEAQPPAPAKQSSKYRTILTLAGAGGGFALGIWLGLAAFDDAVNSDRKVWTTALVSAAAGGVGGYFLGRSLDKSRSPQPSPWSPPIQPGPQWSPGQLEALKWSPHAQPAAGEE